MERERERATVIALLARVTVIYYIRTSGSGDCYIQSRLESRDVVHCRRSTLPRLNSLMVFTIIINAPPVWNCESHPHISSPVFNYVPPDQAHHFNTAISPMHANRCTSDHKMLLPRRNAKMVDLKGCIKSLVPSMHSPSISTNDASATESIELDAAKT